MKVDHLAGRLLIAMPSLTDPNFWRSVVLLGAHTDDEGSFGVVINRPLEIGMDDVLREIGTEVEDDGLPEVLAGGPIQPTHGFVVFEHGDGVEEEEDSDSLALADRGLAISGSTTVLNRLLTDRAVRFYLLLGYAGWAPGQLAAEIEENSWLVAEADTSIVFDCPFEDRWAAALRSIGVEPGSLIDLGGGGEPS